MTKERDYYIDAVKGVAALSVIYIHTVFFSGQAYLPDCLRGFSLFIDIPIFFIISGITSSGNVDRTIKRLVKLQISYLLFISIIYALEFAISGHFILYDYIMYALHQDYLTLPTFRVVEYSMWYMQIYFLVALIGLLIIRFFRKKEIIVVLGLLFLGIVSTSYMYLPLKLPAVFFYLFIFLTGYLLKEVKIDWRLFFVGLVLITGLLTYQLYEYGFRFINAMQFHKFPPNLRYLLASSFSLIIVLALRHRVKVKENNILVYLGQNALFLYFAQGVGSSILFFLVNYILEHYSIDSYLLLGLMYFANIIISLIVMLIFKFLDEYMWVGIGKIRQILA